MKKHLYFLMTITILLVSIVSYRLIFKSPPSWLPNQGNTLVVGRIIYKGHNDEIWKGDLSNISVEIIDYNGRVNKLITDSNGVFSIPLTAGTEFIFKEMRKSNSLLPTSGQSFIAFDRLKQTSAINGVSNIGGIVWSDKGYLKSVYSFKYDFSQTNFALYSKNNPESLWLAEPWHKMNLRRF
jgi:hypothetical protein